PANSCSRLVNVFTSCKPLSFQRSWPFLNTAKVGTPLTPYSAAIVGYSSTSIFTILAASPTLSFTVFRTEDCTLHGPHQVAKKSISTGLSELINSLNCCDIIN